MGQTPEAFHFDDVKIKDGKLYYRNKITPLTNKQYRLRLVGVIEGKLAKEGLQDLGFDIPRGKVMARQAIMLNRVDEELPSASNVAKADDIELQEIRDNVARSMENLTGQLEGESSEDLAMCELLGLDKQLRNIRGLLKVETAKKVQSEKHIEREKGAKVLEKDTSLAEKTRTLFRE